MRNAHRIALVALWSPATAQTVTAIATVVGAGVNAHGNPSVLLPPGTVVASPMTIATGGGGFSASAALNFASTTYRQLLTVNQSTSASGLAGSAGTSVTLDLLVTATAAIHARLRIQTSSFWNPGSTLVSNVDVGANGSVELQLIPVPISYELPIAMAPGALPIRVHNTLTSAVGFVIGSTSMSWGVAYSFEPDPDWTTVVATPACAPGAPQLVAQPTYERTIDFQLSQLAPVGTSVGMLVLGYDPAAAVLPLPPYCVLGVSPAAVGLFVPGGAGTANHGFDMRPWPSGFAFSAQALAFDFATGDLRSSDALRIVKS